MLVRTQSRDSFEKFNKNLAMTWHYTFAPAPPRPQQKSIAYVTCPRTKCRRWVRLAPKYRQNIEMISSLTIAVQDPVTNKVAQIPLSEVAKIDLVTGPAFIYREQQQRYIPIKFSVRGRDLGSTVLEAQRRIAEEVPLPAGYRLEWVVEFVNLQDAIKRLRVIVPLTILLIGILLYINFASLTDTLLGIAVIPMAMIGGVFALLLTGTPFSV